MDFDSMLTRHRAFYYILSTSVPKLAISTRFDLRPAVLEYRAILEQVPKKDPKMTLSTTTNTVKRKSFMWYLCPRIPHLSPLPSTNIHFRVKDHLGTNTPNVPKLTLKTTTRPKLHHIYAASVPMSQNFLLRSAVFELEGF